ncbi:MAG: hypothetical protein CVU55_05785 [Deltaproteobacteria bacterium HGW-Deltaproteobacteria-13]|jgi:hypothetical protein|nr:MAG: hypothetical protein CVU55_05785 [Deltaproteobacteria bacterium HGW-Deltaproteobacteria-13]
MNSVLALLMKIPFREMGKNSCYVSVRKGEIYLENTFLTPHFVKGNRWGFDKFFNLPNPCIEKRRICAFAQSIPARFNKRRESDELFTTAGELLPYPTRPGKKAFI